MILWQQPNLQALEVLNPNGEWIDAPPIPGSVQYVIMRYLSLIIQRTGTLVIK